MIFGLIKPSQVIDFWREAGAEAWFAKNDDFDARFTAFCHDLHMQAAARRLDDWAQTAQGALALLILLDQFPRNAFRGTAHMFATDPLARTVAEATIAVGQDMEIEPLLRGFIYLPFMHSEDLADQKRSVRLNTPLGGDSLEYAIVHRDIIARFGRFPHRNTVLGRATTPQEAAFLADGGFAG
ncbi:DUF924 family protein [Asticcacaulis machinosus]|uniref:DUF924 family protein n=1 Tax=Asticcacaulis machinosus TaxID=2984211 RepID=A0ABT5HLK7_9CAUL|nr:DUF924 family protein [Asticcacaulis machinosus]MDC7677113.1 DUF924 family protein [Asticcacaulis machinosus]